MKLTKRIKRYWRSWKNTRLTHDDVQALTLYPECPQKKLSQIRRELFWLCRNYKRGSWTNKETITDYFNMGIDRKGEDVHKYIFRIEMHNARCSRQHVTCWILRDKWVTAQYLQIYGIATTRPVIYKTPFVSAQETIDSIKKSGQTQFFAKKIDESFGRGAFTFCLKDGKFESDGIPISNEELVTRLDDCVVEPYIEQHETLNALGPGAVSCIRMITICDKGEVNLVLHYFFVPASGARNSHTNQGAIMIGVNKLGELAETGLQLNIHRGKRKVHPDTGIVFKGFKIPFWKEATELVINAHKRFPKIHSIGWDVAISKDGPLIIEANQHWGPHNFQFVYGPGREYKAKFFLN